MVERPQKDRLSAIILAVILGAIGVHRFYLRQPGLGILYILLLFVGLSPMLGIIDAIAMAVRGEDDFNRRYNPEYYYGRRSIAEHHFKEYAQRRTRRRRKKKQNISDTRSLERLKQKGKREFKQYDLEEAIETFEKGLRLDNKDIPLHFNLACSYSLAENKEQAYAHLSKAVELGFDNYDKIMSHDALAFLRIQDDWDEFRKNGFTLYRKNLETSQGPNLLDQLSRLNNLREAGHLSLEEFRQKKKAILSKSAEE